MSYSSRIGIKIDTLGGLPPAHEMEYSGNRAAFSIQTPDGLIMHDLHNCTGARAFKMNDDSMEKYETRLLKSERWYSVLYLLSSLILVFAVLGVLSLSSQTEMWRQTVDIAGYEAFWQPILFCFVAVVYARARLFHIESIHYYRAERAKTSKTNLP